MSRQPEQSRIIHAFQARIDELVDARTARIASGKQVDDLNREIASLRTRLIAYMGALQFLADNANVMARTKKERAALDLEAAKRRQVVRDVEQWAETNLRWHKEAV